MLFTSSAPVQVPTDTAEPLHFFDDTPLWRAFILYSMFVFDDVLDADKLRGSLEALIHREGWRKLGARLRKNSKGELEYHIPATFSKSRPALCFSHVTYTSNVADHAVASQLPRHNTASDRPTVVCDPDFFRSLFCPEGAPTKLDDYLLTDTPVLGLHIVSFADRTLVTIYWPHCLMDAMGKKALLDAWVLILQGRADQVPTPQGSEVDPLVALGTKPTEPHLLAGHRMSLLRLGQWALWNITDFLRPCENRMVRVPGSFLAKLQAEAAADLADMREKGSPEDTVPFLSEGDVLCAWWTRLAISHLSPSSPPSSRLVVLNNAYNLRAPLSSEDDLLPASKGPYVSNAIGFIPIVLSASDILSKPLGHVAASFRRAIRSLGTRAQIEAFAALWRASSRKVPPFFGASGMHMVTFSNWAKARLFETNFSAAVVPGSGSGQASQKRDATARVGRPVYIQNNQFGLTLPNGFPVIGKDGEGNYWLSGYMVKGMWARVEEQMTKA